MCSLCFCVTDSSICVTTITAWYAFIPWLFSHCIFKTSVSFRGMFQSCLADLPQLFVHILYIIMLILVKKLVPCIEYHLVSSLCIMFPFFLIFSWLFIFTINTMENHWKCFEIWWLFCCSSIYRAAICLENQPGHIIWHPAVTATNLIILVFLSYVLCPVLDL